MYKSLLHAKKIPSKNITTSTEGDLVFNNLQRQQEGFESLRKEEEERERGGDTDMSVSNPMKRSRIEREDDEDELIEDDPKESFLDKIKDLAPSKSLNRIMLITKRIISDPTVAINRDTITLGSNNFTLMNFFDFVECSTSQRKPDNIENLTKFVDFFCRAKIPSSYITNRYIKTLINDNRNLGENGNSFAATSTPFSTPFATPRARDGSSEEEGEEEEPNRGLEGGTQEGPDRGLDFVQRLSPSVRWLENLEEVGD